MTLPDQLADWPSNAGDRPLGVGARGGADDSGALGGVGDRDALAALGWDAGWAQAFEPHAAAGLRPARVVAVHRETSIVRDGAGDRPAVVSGNFRFAALARSDFPTVGDWVAIDGDDVVTSILPRRSTFRRMAPDGSRRGTS